MRTEMQQHPLYGGVSRERASFLAGDLWLAAFDTTTGYVALTPAEAGEVAMALRWLLDQAENGSSASQSTVDRAGAASVSPGMKNKGDGS